MQYNPQKNGDNDCYGLVNLKLKLLTERARYGLLKGKSDDEFWNFQKRLLIDSFCPWIYKNLSLKLDFDCDLFKLSLSKAPLIKFASQELNCEFFSPAILKSLTKHQIFNQMQQAIARYLW